MRGVDQRQERGAVLAMLAMFMMIFLIVAAIAVDLSALERRGQTLQNTADAAALAGVVTWQQTGDLAMTRATVEDIVVQNGLTDEDIEVEVNPDDIFTTVEIVIRDTSPDAFLGRLVSRGGSLERAAVAELIDCNDACDVRVELDTPFTAVDTRGSGDGFYPVIVGERMYAINHDGTSIACVDRSPPAERCWNGREAHPFAGPVTGSVTHTVAVGDRVYWAAQDVAELGLFCWDTTIEDPCPHAPIAPLARADALGLNFRQRGGGVVEVDGRIYLFTDDHRAHCIEPATMSPCASYAGGLSTGLGNSGFPALDPALGVSGSNIDRVVDETSGRIYHTLHVANGTLSDPAYETGVYLDCWNTVTAAPCTDFAPVEIFDVSIRQSGRLFLHRDADGTPNGVCATGAAEIACYELDGNRAFGLEATMRPLEDQLPSVRAYTNGMGVHTYHPPSNRLFLTSPRQLSTNYCWDFSSASSCGTMYGFANGTETQDYGFAWQGNCLYGVGHLSVFWSFTPNLASGCPLAPVSVQVEKCDCGPEQSWGLVSFEFDIGPTSPFVVLDVQVRNDAGAIVFPREGEWMSMLGRPTDILDLSSIPTEGTEFLTLFVYVETDGRDPWSGPEPPELAFGHRELPQLIE